MSSLGKLRVIYYLYLYALLRPIPLNLLMLTKNGMAIDLSSDQRDVLVVHDKLRLFDHVGSCLCQQLAEIPSPVWPAEALGQ